MASTGKSAPIIAEPSSTTVAKVVNPPHRPVPSSGCSQGRAARTSSTPLSRPRPRQPSRFTQRVAHGSSTRVGVVTVGTSTVSAKDRKSTRLKLQSRFDLVCRLLLEKKKNKYNKILSSNRENE